MPLEGPGIHCFNSFGEFWLGLNTFERPDLWVMTVWMDCRAKWFSLYFPGTRMSIVGSYASSEVICHAFLRGEGTPPSLLPLSPLSPLLSPRPSENSYTIRKCPDFITVLFIFVYKFECIIWLQTQLNCLALVTQLFVKSLQPINL